MKFGIITHYDVHNHGALLQLNALVQILSLQKITAYALQFDKNYDFLGVDLKNKYNISIKSVTFYLNYLKEQGLKKTLFNIKKKKILELFKQQQHLIGDYYTNENDLNATVIGSDEVFALHTGPTPIFFGHARTCDFAFSYAGSFGPTNLEDIKKMHCLPFVTSGLKSLNGISVRDNNSARIVEELTGKKPILVCDPVILYGYKKELSQDYPVNLPPYILVYAYDKNMNQPKEIEAIQEFAKSHQLKIVSAGFYHKWCDYNINTDPINLLHYFANAQYVITDTFHGSVMSIITNKQMAVITRNNSNKLYNLLQEYGLTDRITDNELKFDKIFCHMVDFDKVNKEIESRRAQSMSFLSDMIKQIQ